MSYEVKLRNPYTFVAVDELQDSVGSLTFSKHLSQEIVGNLINSDVYYDSELRELESNANIATIQLVQVDVRHRGKGVAKRLFEATHQHLANEGFTHVILEPYPTDKLDPVTQEHLVKVYSKLGYKTIVNYHNIYNPNNKGLVMTKELLTTKIKPSSIFGN